jgi:hypothetical protein
MDVLLMLLPPILFGLGASFVIEQWLTPKPQAPFKRPLAALQLHLGTWFFAFAILLLLLLRPWFAMIILLAFQLLLVLVNQAKYDSLREPFIYQDFEYFTDAIRYPRLYLPFFGVARIIAATLGFAAALATGLWLETPLTEIVRLSLGISAWLMLFSMGLLLMGKGLKADLAISLNPAEDLIKLGQIASFWTYGHLERRTDIDPTISPFVTLAKQAEIPIKPNLIAVQSESFFDPRSLSDNIKAEVLAHFDQIKAEASHYGRLQVPAWGANTVRTECAFLTGLTPAQLGVHQFNPYRWLAKHKLPNLAGHLKRNGYRTICIHPHPVSFYRRDRVFPLLGFDQFIDISAFNDGQKDGQYTSDAAVTDQTIATLAATLAEDEAQPVFIFVMTMENHGPLHYEQASPEDLAACYHTPPPAGSEDLTVYLRHLKNADSMIKRLTDCLQANATKRPGRLCWYGDHVPIMMDVYRLYGEPDGNTDYIIWESSLEDRGHQAEARQIDATELPKLLLSTDTQDQCR